MLRVLFSTFFPVILHCPLLAATPQSPAAGRALVFEPNRGQAPAHVKWLARAPGYTLFLTNEGVTMILQDGTADSAGAPRQGFAPVSFRMPSADNSLKRQYGNIVQMK